MSAYKRASFEKPYWASVETSVKQYKMKSLDFIFVCGVLVEVLDLDGSKSSIGGSSLSNDFSSVEDRLALNSTSEYPCGD